MLLTGTQNKNSTEKSCSYKVVGHLGDGTFGRALKCFNQIDNQDYAVKVIRAVERYTESARIEIDILNDMKKQGGCQQGIVYLKEWFIYEDTENLEKARR
jgi:dual-specificity kinase